MTLDAPRALSPAVARFARFAWTLLVYNIFVVLWGAYVRATGSGAGCGSHWPLCNGDVIPRSPTAATVIEFTHRITSGLALIGVVALVIWAWRLFPQHDKVRKFALLSLVFILIEALLGAGLVLFEYVDQNRSVGRAIYLSAHLANTQVLLGVLALTAWFAARPYPLLKRVPLLLFATLPVTLIVGISGAIAALGDTLFPSTSFAEGVRQEMSSTAHFLLRLRVVHPVLALLSAAFIAIATLPLLKEPAPPATRKLAWMVWLLVAVQLLAGLVNVLLLAPVWMQLVHLLLADVLWVTLVLLSAEAEGAPSH